MNIEISLFSPFKVQEWYDRARKFDEMTKSVKKMANRLYKVKNRSLLYELYPYVWDMRGVISLINSYVEWLGIITLFQFCMLALLSK